MNTRRVLVVDDEPGLRVTLAANLELEGFEVVEADSAEAALRAATSEHFDLVLTDIRMPGMNGVELFQALRRARLPTPVVLMTGFALEDLVQNALEEGVYAVLAKPFDVAHAVQTVDQASRVPVVLVVDDTEQVATSTALALCEAGVRARPVTSAEQALAAVRGGNVDVCVVDLVMPDVQGPELARRLKALDAKVVVIAMSGHEVPELIRSVIACGAYAFVQKPFPCRELIRMIAVARGQPRVRA